VNNTVTDRKTNKKCEKQEVKTKIKINKPMDPPAEIRTVTDRTSMMLTLI